MFDIFVNNVSCDYEHNIFDIKPQPKMQIYAFETTKAYLY